MVPNERRTDVEEFLRSGKTNKEAVAHFGLTKQRVSQIARRIGICSRKRSPYVCRKCGGPSRSYGILCDKCYQNRYATRRKYPMTIVCAKCGGSKVLSKGQAMSNRFYRRKAGLPLDVMFCGKSCARQYHLANAASA